MSVADARAALQACENGVALITAQQRSNQALVDNDNQRRRAWEERRNIFNTTRNRNKNARENAQRDWDNRYNEWYRDRRNIFNAGCGLVGSNPGCPSGSNDVGHDGCWTNCVGSWCTAGHNRRCQRTEETSRTESINNTNRERGPRPDNFNEPEFSEIEPRPSAQNQTPINITCCANVTSVIGSQVTDSTIEQQNNCLQTKRNEVNAAAAAAEAAAAAAAAAAANALEEEKKKKEKEKMIIAGVIAMIILLCICSCIIIVIGMDEE